MYTKIMNIDNVFGLFSSNEKLDTEKPQPHADFTETPLYRLGMYKKLILNHVNFNKKVLKFFKEANQELDIGDVEYAGEFVVYNRAWYYIKDLNINNPEETSLVKRYSDPSLHKTLELGINFFEKNEEYEKCAFLLKILNESKS